jgi:phage-related protein
MWLHGEVRTPPLSAAARVEAGLLLRRLQRGESLGLPHSRPLPALGRHCHELRIVDADVLWRMVYRVDPDAVIVAEVFRKTTQSIPPRVFDKCRRRLRPYDATVNERE